MDQSSRNQPSDDTVYNNFGISASRGLRDTRTHDRRLTESKARDSYGRVGGGNVGENPENLQGYSLQMSRKDNWRTTNRDIENNETHVKHIEDIQQPSSFQDTQLKTEENRNYGQARLGPSRIEESSRPLSDTRQNGSQYNDGRDFQFGVSGIYGDSEGRYNFDDHHSERVEPHEKRKNSNVSSNLSWIDMAFSGTFRRNYFDKIDEFRPRISVRGNTKSYNYAKDDEISEFSTRSDARYCSRCCVLTVAVVLVVLLLTAAIAVPVVLVNMKDLKPTPNTTQYYEIVDMNATLARVFIKEYGQPDSPQFKAFNEEFCLTIQNTQSATSNGTYKETYQGCEVSDIRNGSCIVSYTLIFIRSEIPVLATSIVDDVSTQWMPTANDFNLITINVIKIQTEAETIKIRSIKMKSDNYGKTSTSVTPSTIKISNSTTVTPLSTTQTDTINTFDLTTTSTSTTRIDKTSTASSTVIVDTTNTFSTMPSETTTEMASTTPIKTISTAGSKSSAIPTSISTRSVITTTNFHTKDLDTTSTEGSTSTKSTINTVDITTASTAISTSPSTKNTKESTTTMPTTSTVDTTASSTPLSTTSTEISSTTRSSTTSNEGSTTKMSAMTTAGTTTQTTTFTAPSTTNTDASTMTTTDATTTSTTTIPPSTTSTEGHTTDTTTSTTASTSPSTTSTEESTKTMAKTSTVKTTVIYTASSTPLSTTSNEGSTTKMSAMTTAGTTEHTTTFTAPSTTNTEVSTMTTADATTTSTTTSIPPSTTSTEGPTIPISTSITGLPITASPSTVESTSVTTTQNHNSITSTYVTTTDTNDKIISTDGMKSTSESTTTMTTTIMGSPTLEVSQKTGIVGQDLHLFCNSSYTGTWSYIELTISNQSGGMIEPIATIYSNETVVTPNDEKWTVVFNNINSSFVISRATFKLSNAALGRERCLSDVTFQCSISIGDQTFTNGKTLNISAPPTAPIEIETMHEYIHSSDLEVNCTFKVDPHLSGWTFLEIMNSEEEVERTVPKAITPAGIDNDCSTTIHVQFGKDIPINIENNGSYVRCAYHNDILNHTERSDKKIIIVAVPDVYLDSLNKNPRKEGYLTVEKGNTLFLACRASSTNSLVFKFTKEAQEEVIFGKNDTGQYFSTSYISRTATESENGFTLLRIDSITCSDEGTYTCEAVAADGKTVKSSALILEVTGIITFTIHEDFVELFPRLGYNHVCEVQNTGIGSNISVTITSPSGLTDTYELGSSVGVYDAQKKFTRVPLQNADEMLVIREDFITTNGCEITQRLTFLLNISNTWDNGTLKCAYTDDDGEQYSQSKLIHTIPRNHCDGYPDSSIRVHPGGCNLFVRCEQIDNALYPFGASCGEQCIDLSSNQCENCTTASCHEQTTPAPPPPTTTVDPNLSYLECNDSTLEIGSQSITVDNCVILRNNYTVLNISKQRRSGDAIFIGSITHTSMSIMSSLQFDATITVVSHRIVFTFNDVQCTDEANYTITVVYEQKILWKTTFQVDVIVNDTHGSLAVQSQYKEGDILSLTGTFFVNAADDIEVYYKYPFDSDYTKAEGTIIKDDTPYNCSVKVDWVQKDTLILAAVMNGTRIKAVDKRRSRTLDQFVLIVEATNIGFATYTDEVNIGESANISCTVRGINWNQINITKIENNEASTVLTQIKSQSQPITSIPRVSGLLSEQGSTAILTLMIPDVNCTDSASYNCTALSDTNSIETTGQPFQLRITSPPSTPTLYIHPNWVASLAYAEYEHKCSGSIGYPDAKYQMGIKLVSGDGQNEFVYKKKDRPDCQTERSGRQCTVAISTEEKMYVEYDRTTVESCQEEQTIKFILELDYRWDQGNISCFLHNAESDVIEYTTTKTIVLIKTDTCINATNNYYIRHPNGCDKYIHCSNNIPFGKACSTSNHCVDIPTQRLCIPCDTAQCEEETTTVLASTVSTATTTDLTTTPSIIGVTCNSTSTEIGTKNEEIICILHVDNFEFITLRRLSSNREITSISRNGTISKTDPNAFSVISNFQASPKTFTYVISNVNCTVGGTYEVELSLNTSETSKTSFDVNIKPEIPVLSISADSREDSQSAVHSCTGYLGYPKGNFVVEIKEVNSTEFSTYDDYVNFETSTSDSCSDTFEQKFALKLPATFNHSKARCRSENEVTKISGQEILSNVEDIMLIPKNLCHTVNGSEYNPHPRGCNYYIRCVHNIPYGFYTGEPTSCVDYNPFTITTCTSCSDAKK